MSIRRGELLPQGHADAETADAAPRLEIVVEEPQIISYTWAAS
jgi:hypothetical protein